MQRAFWVVAVAVGLGACAGPGTPEGVVIQQELTAQEQSLQSLSGQLAAAVQEASKVRVSTPAEVRALREKMSEFQAKLRPKWDALDAPVKKAEAEREAAESGLKSILSLARIPVTNEQRVTAWCGDDGCGGNSCAARCLASEICYEQRCRCVPICDGKSCGMDGCGGFCGINDGKCEDDQVCQADGTCVAREYYDVACQPSCFQNGRAVQQSGRTARQVQDFSPTLYQLGTPAVTPGSAEQLESWVKALDAQRAGVEAQVAELGQLPGALEDSKKAADASKAAVARAVAEEKAALVKAAAAKAKPADFPEAVKATEERTAANAKLKTDEQAVAELTAKVAQSKAQSDVLGKAEARIKAELGRLVPVLRAAKEAADKVREAKAAVDAAVAARAIAREEVLKGEGADLEKIVAEIESAMQAVLSTEDLALLDCNEVGCSIASVARGDLCRAKVPAPNCLGGGGAAALVSRLEKAAAQRKAAVTTMLAAPETKAARDTLSTALKVALAHVAALEPVDGGGESRIAELLGRATASRDAVGAISAESLEELEAVHLPRSDSLQAKVNSVIMAAKAVPQPAPLERDVALLAHVAVLVEAVTAAHANRTKLLGRSAGMQGLIVNGIPASALPLQAPPSWKAKGTMSAQVVTGSCANNSTTKVTCDASTKGVEARVLDVTGIELKPLMDIKETGAVQGRTASVSADGLTLSLTGETGCGADKLVTTTVTVFVCE
jgi:hypothetical protein